MGDPTDDVDRPSTTQVMVAADLRSGDTLAPPVGASGRLVMLVGQEIGQVYILGPRGALIGRAHEADIPIDGPDVSRAHARISWSDGRFVLEDLGSRNGTQVNGVPVRQHVLAVGDRIQIG